MPFDKTWREERTFWLVFHLFPMIRSLESPCVQLLYLQAVSVGRRRLSADFQLLFRLIKCLVFLTFFSIFITLLAIPAGLKARDIIVCILAFGPTGWGLLQVVTESLLRTL